jgi:hypothetical protein
MMIGVQVDTWITESVPVYAVSDFQRQFVKEGRLRLFVHGKQLFQWQFRRYDFVKPPYLLVLIFFAT